MARLRVPFVLLLLLAAACTQEAGDITDPGSQLPASSDDLVLRIDTGGGFVPVEFALTDLPEVSIYADGRVIVQGAQIEIFPPPASTPLFVRTLTAEGLAQVREAAREARLTGPDRELGNDMIADAATTTFIYVDEDGARHTTSAYALGDFGTDGGEDPALREDLMDLQRKLTGLDDFLPAGAVSEEEPFEAEAMRVFVQEPRETDAEIQPNELEWPLGDQPLTSFGDQVAELGIRCGVVEGEALETLREAIAEATTITRWVSEGQAYGLSFRPLLPDEEGCPDELG